MIEYAPWSLTDLVTGLRSGAISATEALDRSRERIAATDDALRAWVTTAPVDTREAADRSLAGVPMGVKDIIDVRGLVTRCGSELRDGALAARVDSAIVSAWRAAGALPIGKTVTTEFAYFSPGPTDNPARPGHTPGGSSSGSAAAVASGQVPLALGSQTAASVTRPASFCGVASLVMTRSRFPSDGVVGLSPSLDSHGFFTAGARDLRLAWTALSGEPRFEGSAPRILLWEASALGRVTDDMRGAVATAIAKLQARGATIERFADDALVQELAEAHPIVMAYEAARERADELARSDRLSRPLRELLERGRDTPRAAYEEARSIVDRAARVIGRSLADDSLILGPAALGAAPEGLDATGDPLLSRPWQALGLPVAAIPGLRDPSGSPLGLQLIAAPGREAALLSAAEWVESGLTP